MPSSLPGAQVQAARRGEVQALSVLRYLDALSVYFWAATSVLFSFTTFALFVLTGQSAGQQHLLLPSTAAPNADTLEQLMLGPLRSGLTWLGIVAVAVPIGLPAEG